jgi:hypothetical protein
MATQEEGQWVVPNPQVPRTFGILNIIFGILLLLFGAYTIVMLFIGPKLQYTMVVQMKEQAAAKKAQREAKLAELKKKEDSAKTKEEKDSIADERETLEKSVDIDVSGVMDEAMSTATDTRIRAYSWVESTTGILLNIALIISGVGLLRLAEWSRRLAVGVAWLKILRWVTIMLFTLIVIVPITTEKTQKMFQEIEKQTSAKSGGAAPFPMASMAQFTAIATAVTSVASALLASIYPALSLWFLSRPATRAAVMARAKPSGPPPGFAPGETS